MSVGAVLNAAYATLARAADERDRSVAMFGGKDEDGNDVEPTARHDLDQALGLLEDIDVFDDTATTNVIELSAWIAGANRVMQ